MKSSFQKHLWVSLGIILVTGMAAAGGLYYLSGDLAAQNAKIQLDKDLLARQAAAVSILAELESAAPQAATYSDAIQKLLPSHDELIGFSQWATAIGATHNVSISFSFTGTNTPASPAVDPTTPGTDGFNMSATGGSPEDLVAFVKDLESQAAGFLLTFTSFNLSRDGDAYTLSLQGQLFSQ